MTEPNLSTRASPLVPLSHCLGGYTDTDTDTDDTTHAHRYLQQSSYVTDPSLAVRDDPFVPVSCRLRRRLATAACLHLVLAPLTELQELRLEVFGLAAVL